MNKALKDGWISFAAFCVKHNVKRDGNEYRRLKKLSDPNKCNLGTGTIPYWFVYEEECMKVFGVK